MDNEYLRIFRALSDENRIRVLELLSHGEQCACVLISDLRISQPTLSHHMKILCASGLVKSRRVGKWNYYSIDAEGCRHAGGLLNAIVNHDMERWLKAARVLARLGTPRGHKRNVAVRRIAV